MPVDENKIYKISECLNESSKRLELTFIYQAICIIAYLAFLVGGSNNIQKISIFGLEVSSSIFLTTFPVVLLFFLSKMAISTMLYIDLSETFFSLLSSKEVSLEDKEYYSVFRPSSIFLSIPFSRRGVKDKSVKIYFHRIIIILIYMFPGLNMALVLYSAWNSSIKVVAVLLCVLAILVFTGLFIEYYSGTNTKKYRYILYVTFLSMFVSCVILGLYL